MIQRQDLEYELPPERIAQSPVRPRDASRLLVLDRQTGALAEHRFAELAELIGPHDLLVTNDTRVVPARLRGRKKTGGRVEAMLLERRPDASWTALVKSGGRLRPGLELLFESVSARVEDVDERGICRLRFDSDASAPEELLEKIGELPLPPYIRRDRPLPDDAADYQTVFAREPGAVAAPTASLHFTEVLAARLPLAKITLHVGPGTFRPIRCEKPEQHTLDAEAFHVPEATALRIAETRAAGGRVIAVGTTVVRALETTGGEAGTGRTDLYVLPGHEFGVVDSLITNFHLPGSTLLALVMAFAGVAQTQRAYAHAIAEGFRFYSYGDAMWIR